MLRIFDALAQRADLDDGDEGVSLVSLGFLGLFADPADPEAAAFLVQCLIKRRDKIGKAYFAKVLPFDRFRLQNGTLGWDDLSGSVRDARVSWFAFNNQTGERSPAATMPAGGYGAAEISAASRPRQTIVVYTEGQRIVGIDRNW